MKNYVSERYLERYTPPLEWKPKRLQILEKLIYQTSHFYVDLEKSTDIPNLLHEDQVVMECIEGSYSPQKAKFWVFIHLYGHAIEQANSIGMLLEGSFARTPYQLWRTLCETYVICKFLATCCKEQPQVFQDYISHTLLRFWIRKEENFNQLCRDRKYPPCHYYDEDRAKHNTRIYKSKFGKFRDYAWARSIIKKKKVSFHDIMKQIKGDMTIFYRLASQEIHPTLGTKFMLPHATLPLEPIFMLPLPSYQEMGPTYLTAWTLSEITRHVDSFLDLDQETRKSWDSLVQVGDDTLEQLMQEEQPFL